MTISTAEKTDRGHCLCNAVQFEIKGNPIYNVICHCENCKRFGGSAFHTASIFLKSQFTLLPTTDPSVITTYADKATQSGQPLQRQFCSICGSGVAALTAMNNDIISIPAGVTEGAGQDWTPQKEQFIKDKCTVWVPDFGEVSGLELSKSELGPESKDVGELTRN